MNLADIIEGIFGTRPALPALTSQEVSNVVVDSRTITPGSVFFAEYSGSRDGHQFVPDALQRGAVAVVVEARAASAIENITRVEGGAIVTPLNAGLTPLAIVVDDTLLSLQQLAAWWRSKMPVKAMGITGSVGKTTSKEIIAAVLSQRYVTLKSEASLNNEIGLPLTLLRLRPYHQRAVLEMGTYGLGEIRQLCEWAKPQVGILTIVGTSHLERMGSQEVIAEAKGELVEALPPDGVAILNGDDFRVRAMASRTKARVFLYGLTPDCDLWADQLDSHGLEGISFHVHYGRESLAIRVPLLGIHSVHTALRAIAVGLTDNLTWEEIIAGLHGLPGQVRLVVTPGVHRATILDDTYNASPESGLAALNLLREMPGRRIAVLGDMLELGDIEEEGHLKVGCRAAEVVDLLIAVGERSKATAEGARECGMVESAIRWYPDNATALAALRDILSEGDFVLIKGSRGVQMETIVAGLAAAPSTPPAEHA
ncbi:MAG: UDP-N-acetylmuramoyl-tripeptide--D-alanyl-D-alanine ligase [Anaerolineae bacterium]